METKPTAGAMRAANLMAAEFGCPDYPRHHLLAAIIDREAVAPAVAGLLTEFKALVDAVTISGRLVGYNSGHLDRATAAIARYERSESHA